MDRREEEKLTKGDRRFNLGEGKQNKLRIKKEEGKNGAINLKINKKQGRLAQGKRF